MTASQQAANFNLYQRALSRVPSLLIVPTDALDMKKLYKSGPPSLRHPTLHNAEWNLGTVYNSRGLNRLDFMMGDWNVSLFAPCSLRASSRRIVRGTPRGTVRMMRSLHETCGKGRSHNEL